MRLRLIVTAKSSDAYPTQPPPNTAVETVRSIAAVGDAMSPLCASRPRCPQRGLPPVLPSPLVRLLHYLKRSLVFICRADDVATTSTFPSPAVYIRESIWLYKTRQQKGGGTEPERGETWKPFYRAVECALELSPWMVHMWWNVKDVSGLISSVHQLSKSTWHRRWETGHQWCEMGESSGFGAASLSDPGMVDGDEAQTES